MEDKRPAIDKVKKTKRVTLDGETGLKSFEQIFAEMEKKKAKEKKGQKK